MDFYVNRSPSLGECRMKLDSAKIELQTEFSEFSVLCFEWKDDVRKFLVVTEVIDLSAVLLMDQSCVWTSNIKIYSYTSHAKLL